MRSKVSLSRNTHNVEGIPEVSGMRNNASQRFKRSIFGGPKPLSIDGQKKALNQLY